MAQRAAGAPRDTSKNPRDRSVAEGENTRANRNLIPGGITDSRRVCPASACKPDHPRGVEAGARCWSETCSPKESPG